MVDEGGQRLVPHGVQPLPGPGGGQQAEHPLAVGGVQVQGAQRLFALLGERLDPRAVLRRGDLPEGQQDLAQAERLLGGDHEVLEERPRHQAHPAPTGQGQRDAVPVPGDPPGQAAVVLAQQRVQDTRGEVPFPRGHATTHGLSVAKAVRAASTLTRSGPTARTTPR
ncbi:hypothetical protein ACFYY8_09810 [Streptosporangium sp. NPDC001559]|uniref:hypothetical protein n=1 Tax=Streptosporangium sp. NPDC001559 TaxID=3366187 RepID=UPI0036E25C03